MRERDGGSDARDRRPFRIPASTKPPGDWSGRGSRTLDGPARTGRAMLTVEEAASYLSLSESAIYRLVQRGELPGHKVGRHWRFQRQTLENWVGQAGR